jgi:hypothetical protein
MISLSSAYPDWHHHNLNEQHHDLTLLSHYVVDAIMDRRNNNFLNVPFRVCCSLSLLQSQFVGDALLSDWQRRLERSVFILWGRVREGVRERRTEPWGLAPPFAVVPVPLL